MHNPAPEPIATLEAHATNLRRSYDRACLDTAALHAEWIVSRDRTDALWKALQHALHNPKLIR